MSTTDLFWNEDHEGTRWVEDGYDGLIEPREVVDDGEADFIYARWARSAALEFAAPSGDPPVPTPETNDLSAEPFYLLVSCGPTDPDTHLPDRHERAAASVEPIMFVQ